VARAGNGKAHCTFEEVREKYAQSGRFYHTLDHIENGLETVERLGSHARNQNAVKLAAWLHDVVYESRATDNEERSADHAESGCARDYQSRWPTGCVPDSEDENA
jgi:predicted metal-dependent HD superfamily phosphohydrolase